MTPALQMLLDLWTLTLGQTDIYGNAIGCKSGRPNEIADLLILNGMMGYNPDTTKFMITQDGIDELARNGLITP